LECAAWHSHRIGEEFEEVGEITVGHSKSLVYLFEGQLGGGNHSWPWKCPRPDHGTQLRRQLWEEREVGFMELEGGKHVVHVHDGGTVITWSRLLFVRIAVQHLR
jgi:hypothetical protein